MSKFKHSICPACNKQIERHDTKRISRKVAKGSSGQGVFKEYHLTCSQGG